jgi:hypothetical protein
MRGCWVLSDYIGNLLTTKAEVVRAEFGKAVGRGAAPADAPPCFSGQGQWEDYVACWCVNERLASHYSKHVEYCRDCTPEHKRQMMEQGRCAHPETLFVLKEDEIVGVSSHYAQRWKGSLFGYNGELLDLPSEEVIEQTLAELGPEKPRRRSR